MNIFDLPELPLSEELTIVLDENKNVRIERIISTGQLSEWYDQAETEFGSASHIYGWEQTHYQLDIYHRNQAIIQKSWNRV